MRARGALFIGSQNAGATVWTPEIVAAYLAHLEAQKPEPEPEPEVEETEEAEEPTEPEETEA